MGNTKSSTKSAKNTSEVIETKEESPLEYYKSLLSDNKINPQYHAGLIELFELSDEHCKEKLIGVITGSQSSFSFAFTPIEKESVSREFKLKFYMNALSELNSNNTSKIKRKRDAISSNIAVLHYQDGNKTLARFYAESSVNRSNSLYVLGMLAKDSGDYDEALDYLTRSYRRAKDDITLEEIFNIIRGQDMEGDVCDRYIENISELETLKSENIRLKGRLELLEPMVYYSPGMPGYDEAKTRYLESSAQFEKRAEDKKEKGEEEIE